jgi:hypothetical protein
MASKDVELKVVMENLPIGAGENELVAEVQSLLQGEYADGVKVTVSVTAPAEQPKKAKAANG